MRKLAYAFLMLLILLSGLLLIQKTSATTVSGQISSSTTWGSSMSPIYLDGSVTVNSGVTLTIQAGVTVNFGSNTFVVNGELIARGTSNNRIVFLGNPPAKIDFTSSSTPYSTTMNTGCSINYAIISSVQIASEYSSPNINECYFYSAPNALISIWGGSPYINNNVLNLQYSDGIKVINSGTPTIYGNTINGQGQGYGIATDGNAIISNNNILNCFTGILSSGASVIEQNNIVNNQNDGINSDNPSTVIQYNVIARNKCGVSFAAGNVQANTITQNYVGLWGPKPSVTISNNNIYENYNSSSGITQNIHLTETANLNALNCWWGLTDAAAINSTIWDYKNDTAHLGTLNFSPFLTQFNSNAPAVPSSIPVPTAPPTPAPEASPTPTETPTSTPFTAATPTPFLGPTDTPIAPTESPDGVVGGLRFADLIGVAVVVIAILTSIIVILIINKKVRYAQSQLTPPPPP